MPGKRGFCFMDALRTHPWAPGNAHCGELTPWVREIGQILSCYRTIEIHSISISIAYLPDIQSGTWPRGAEVRSPVHARRRSTRAPPTPRARSRTEAPLDRF